LISFFLLLLKSITNESPKIRFVTNAEKKGLPAYKKVILKELVGLRFPFSTSNLKFETVPALCILSSKNFSKPDKKLTVNVLPSELACVKNAGVYSCALFYH